MGIKTLALKLADENIVSGSLLTVESNHSCVVKGRGAVLNVYDTGQLPPQWSQRAWLELTLGDQPINIGY